MIAPLRSTPITLDIIMGQNSKIQWTDHTFNPWRGCAKVSEGCAHCYAETLSKRNPKLLGEWGRGRPRVPASEHMWGAPLKWEQAARSGSFQQVEMEDGTVYRGVIKEIAALQLVEGEIAATGPARPRVFCASMADWLDDEVPIEWLARLLALIHDTPHLDWLLLTKRPQNWESRMTWVLEHWGAEDNTRFGWLAQWVAGLPLRQPPSAPIPPDNIWCGVSVENQKRAEERIPELIEIPAAVRFLSCEPQLGPLDLSYWLSEPLLPWLDWVIAGGESGHHARPMNPAWARSLRDQCIEARVPFFMKQMGGVWKPFPPIPDDLLTRDFPNPARYE